MGISAEVHRARIGSYYRSNQRQGPSRKVKIEDASCKISLPLSLLLTMLLLFMAGIEVNPGPSYACSNCKDVFSSAEKYFKHQKENHPLIKCCFTECANYFLTLSAFQSHLTRHHNQRKDASNLPSFAQCPVAKCSLPSTGRSFKQHLEDHLDAGESFKCPYSTTCTTQLSKKMSFRVHVSQKHAETVPATNLPSTSSAPNPVPLPTQFPIPSPSIPNPFPPNVIKNKVVLFYMELEGLKVLPSSTVQFISENVATLSELSHHNMKLCLERELYSAGLTKRQVLMIANSVFNADPVYNVHHVGLDREQVTSIHLRQQEMRKRAPYVAAIEIQLKASTTQGKTKVAHYVPLRETLEILLRDEHVKKEILNSFARQSDRSNHEILEDFFHGSAFQQHLAEHNHHKCIQIIMFQDAFEFSPFGPASGLYKTDGWYFIVGNLPAEFRSKLDMIMLNFLIQEQFLKPSLNELLNLVSKHEEALATMIAEFQELKKPQIIIDDTAYPVCLIVMTGDNLGQHQLGGYVQSFSGNYWCRYCPTSKEEFRKNPHVCKPLRTKEDYDECVAKARESFIKLKENSISTQQKRKNKALLDAAAGKEVEVPTSLISKNAEKNLQAVHYQGIKPLPSPLNKIPGFHVNLAMAPCLAHDLFEGVVDSVLAKILEQLVSKKWFDLPTLNRNIIAFKYQGADAADAPNKIRSFEGIKGHAVETWTLLRLLPLILDKLVKDPEDPFWLLYLQLKEVVEYICAPKISLKQINYLASLIQEFLCALKDLLPYTLPPNPLTTDFQC